MKQRKIKNSFTDTYDINKYKSFLLRQDFNHSYMTNNSRFKLIHNHYFRDNTCISENKDAFEYKFIFKI